jgi:capsular exopolysaccharide synthesis family protein
MQSMNGPGFPSAAGTEKDFSSRFRREITFQEIWQTIRHRKLIFLGSLLVGVCLALAYSLALPIRYEGVTKLTVDFGVNESFGAEASALAQATGVDPSTKLQTQVNVLETDSIAWDVITRLRLDQAPAAAIRRFLIGPFRCLSSPETSVDSIDPKCRQALIDEFHRRLSVQPVSRTQIIELRYRSRSPELAAKVVNSLADIYVERNFKAKYQSAMRASTWLSGRLGEVRADAEAAEMKYIAYQKQSGLIGMDESHNIQIERLDALNQQLVSAEALRVVREARMRIAEEGDPEGIADIVPGGTLQTLHNAEAQLRTELADLNTRYDENYPKVIAVKDQLAQVQRATATELTRTRQRLESEYEAARNSESLIRSDFDKQKQQVYQTSEAAVQIALLKRDVDSSNELYEEMVRDLKAAGILAGIKANTISVIDPANLPVMPVEPSWARNLLLGLIAGVALGLGLSFALESMDTTVTTVDEVVSLTGLPALGVVFEIARHRGRAHAQSSAKDADAVPIPAWEQPSSQISDAYRSIRTALQLSNPGAPPKVILVTSSLPQEGKTTTSMNLAVVYSQKQRRVLLVDGDLRCGDLHKQFGVDGGKGLSSVLIGQDPDQFYKSHPKLPNLFILPAGARPPYPPDMLDSDRMRHLVELWRQEFDTVIVDSTPVIGLSDAVILATMSDTAVLVVRAGQSRRQAVIGSVETLRHRHAHLGGFVMNGLHSSGKGFYGENVELYSHYFDQPGKSSDHDGI